MIRKPQIICSIGSGLSRLVPSPGHMADRSFAVLCKEMMKVDKHRVQFDFAPDALKRLDTLVAQTGAASRAEVIRRALALLDKVLEVNESGDELIVRDASGTEQRIMVV